MKGRGLSGAGEGKGTEGKQGIEEGTRRGNVSPLSLS